MKKEKLGTPEQSPFDENTARPETTTPATFGDAVGTVVDFFPDLPKKKADEIAGRQLLILDAKIVRKFKSKFGTSDFALMLCADPSNTAEKFTTICSGGVVVKAIETALDGELLPLLGTLKKRPNKDNSQRYWSIE